eukprot:3295103-Prymnesium_polylepis.2
MLGGYGVFGAGAYVEKTVTGMDSHFTLRIQFTFFKIDYWEGFAVLVYVDGALGYRQTFQLRDGDGGLCGLPSFWGQGDDGVFIVDAV